MKKNEKDRKRKQMINKIKEVEWNKLMKESSQRMMKLQMPIK